MIVTIDGPAGSGKSTAARGLARRLEFEYLDTGAMYRAVALVLKRAAIPFAQAGPVVEALGQTRLEMRGGRVLVNGEDVSEAIRVPEISEASSRVAAEAHVRAVLVCWQRQIAQGRNMVCEGRDQGTVVFPDAACKFFLTAAPETRARRRLEELRQRGIACTLDQVLADILSRDERDATRSVGPLLRPSDALVIETDHLTPEEVVDRLETQVRACWNG